MPHSGEQCRNHALEALTWHSNPQRLGSSGGSKPMHELLAAGRRGRDEAHYWAQVGRHQLNQECAGRQRHFERELDAYLAEMS